MSRAFTPAEKLGTSHRGYTLRHNQNGTDTLTLNPVELLNPAQLQSDFAKYGIPAKVTTGSYCTSNPEPAGLRTGRDGPGQGSLGSGDRVAAHHHHRPVADTRGHRADRRRLPSTSGPAAGEQQANFSLMNSSSYTCTSTPPDMSQPDTSNGDFGLLYGGPRPSGSWQASSATLR